MRRLRRLLNRCILLFALAAMLLALSSCSLLAWNLGKEDPGNPKEEHAARPLQSETPASPTGSVKPSSDSNDPTGKLDQSESSSDNSIGKPDQNDPSGTAWTPDIVFSTVDIDGNTWTDACFSEYRITMINLWAYWCGPCVEELPDLQKLFEDYADRGVQLLGISPEEYERDNLQTLQSLGITYPCLRYTEDFDSYLMTGYVPTTIFVDSQGKVIGNAYVGSRSYADWADVLEGLL